MVWARCLAPETNRLCLGGTTAKGKFARFLLCVVTRNFLRSQKVPRNAARIGEIDGQQNFHAQHP